MERNIDKIRNNFFKKSISVGHHNVKYTWMQIMLVILNCIKCLESIEEGAKNPSAQTIRDRLFLDGTWLEYFHENMWKIASLMVKRFFGLKWFISIDETYSPFFGDRDKLNKKFEKLGLGKFVFGYRAKTPGATGSFCFLLVSLCCCKIRIPVAVKMMKLGEHYKPWLEPLLKRLHKLVPKAVVLADRGFGKATWFFLMIDKLGMKFDIRVPLRKKENKNKVSVGVARFQYWMKDVKTKEKVLLTVRVVKDKKNRIYLLATNIEKKTNRQILECYLNRWDIENIFKDANRVMLKTSSPNPRMRLFSLVLSFFLFALWQVEKMFKNIFCSLRRFVKQIVNLICNIIKMTLSPLGVICIRNPD
jgi:hypothetical protein